MNNERDKNQTTQPGNPNRDQQNQGKPGQFDQDQQRGGQKPGQFDRDQQGQQGGHDRQQGGINKDREAKQK